MKYFQFLSLKFMFYYQDFVIISVDRNWGTVNTRFTDPEPHTRIGFGYSSSGSVSPRHPRAGNRVVSPFSLSCPGATAMYFPRFHRSIIKICFQHTPHTSKHQSTLQKDRLTVSLQGLLFMEGGCMTPLTARAPLQPSPRQHCLTLSALDDSIFLLLITVTYW